MSHREPTLTSSPAGVATAFFSALHDARWHEAVALVDAQRLEEFHEMEVADLLTQAQRRVDFRRMREGGGGVGYSPDRTANSVLLKEFGAMPILGIEGIGTIADYAACSPAEMLARHFEAGNGPFRRYSPWMLARVKRHFESQPEGRAPDDLFPARPRARNRRVIGEVIETIAPDPIAHVLYRVEQQSAEAEDGDEMRPFRVEMLHLRNRRGWRVAVERRDFMLFGTPWFDLDFDWEPEGSQARIAPE